MESGLPYLHHLLALASGDPATKIQRYFLACLSHASYMITDEKTKTAAVVDPQRDIDQYIADPKAAGSTIKHVFLTHFHADFIAGRPVAVHDMVGGYKAWLAAKLPA